MRATKQEMARQIMRAVRYDEHAVKTFISQTPLMAENRLAVLYDNKDYQAVKDLDSVETMHRICATLEQGRRIVGIIDDADVEQGSCQQQVGKEKDTRPYVEVTVDTGCHRSVRRLLVGTGTSHPFLSLNKEQVAQCDSVGVKTMNNTLVPNVLVFPALLSVAGVEDVFCLCYSSSNQVLGMSYLARKNCQFSQGKCTLFDG
jgi:hypothetical protein